MFHINWLAAVAAGVLGFFPGAIWYSKLMFLPAWQADTGLSKPPEKPSEAVRIVTGLVLSIFSAIIFAVLMGRGPDLLDSVHAALAVAIAFITPAFAIQYLFEGKPLRLTLINGGYHTVQFLIFGIVLGLWH